MNFYEDEDRDGLRFSWNVLPATKLETTRLVLPIGCLFTPLKQRIDLPSVQYGPIHCERCGAILNPYCEIDFKRKIWLCNFCNLRNKFPLSYTQISEQLLPLELHPNSTSIEYKIDRAPSQTPSYIFLIDRSTSEEELESLKTILIEKILQLPEDSYLGLITFGKNVWVHDLNPHKMEKIRVLRGDKFYSAEKICQLLYIPNSPIVLNQNMKININQNQKLTHNLKKYLKPISEVKSSIKRIISGIKTTNWLNNNNNSSKRDPRAIGNALAIALTLVQSRFSPGRIVTLLSGPATIGPGMIVSMERSDQIRSHHDLFKESTKYVENATKFYNALANSAARSGHAIDLFSVSFDQVGLFEMQNCSKLTGGTLTICESFKQESFKNSLSYLLNPLNFKLDCSIELKISPEMKLSSYIGNFFFISNSRINSREGGSTAIFKACSLTESQTFAFYFDVITHQQKVSITQPGFFQFKTLYQRPNGEYKLRVTTCSKQFAQTKNQLTKIEQSFDKEAAAIIFARKILQKTNSEQPKNVIRWLDRTLINFFSYFADYKHKKPETFKLQQQFNLFPQLMYHFRRSRFLKIFGYSPDETTFHKFTFFNENTQNSLTMIQPMLFQYSMNQQQSPVLLDHSSLTSDCLLLFDNFFSILIWRGEQIAEWIKQGYQDQEEYKDFKTLIEMPVKYADLLIKKRFPKPKIIICNQDSSQERFLLSQLNPSQSRTINNSSLTDDLSFQMFMEHVKKLVCEN
ncbi:protein transport protein sec23 [Anaeramoeba flamelloides]|uniref:Protein transport protein SEC23 n=1 Tax=Anaeramoeba flamelloides TaxID=1746091 RepID=A0AAV7ZIM7_9EUKA|nr:protein transport protein sec23 [Anaeramoeba flamelloides]